MGCGGSTTFAEDGSVVAGKGETKIEWNADKPVEVGFYYYTEKDAKILVKEFPMDKECVEKVFEDSNVVSSDGGMHWIKVVPGNRYAMKYVEGGHSVSFPGQKVLDLPKKIHAFHTKDDAAKDKLCADLKKEAEKDEGNAYNNEGSEDKIKSDVDSLGGFQSVTQFPDEMKVFKKACQTVEDLHPWNLVNPVTDIWTEFGKWDETDGKLARELALADKVKVKAEEEVRKRGPEVGHKALSTMQTGFKKVIEGAVQGACKKAGPDVSELAPNLGARIDNGDGCVPGVARVEARKLEPKEGEEKKEEPAPEGDEDPIEKAAKEEYEADKGRLDELKKDDGSDWKSEVESYLKSLHGSISEQAVSADDSTAVIGAVEGFQVPCFITGEDGDDATVKFARNNFQDETVGKVPKQSEISTISGTDASDEKVGAFTTLPDAKDDWLERGRFVTVREGREFNQGWVKKLDGDTVTFEDQLKVTKTAKVADVFTHVSQQQLASRGVALTPNFAPMKFWWIAAQDENITTRKVRVWRFGARDETLVEVDLKPVMAKAKPSKEVKEPTHEVHIGFSADVDILLGAKYAYNFQIGEETFFDFGEKAKSDKACKVFTCNARVEY